MWTSNLTLDDLMNKNKFYNISGSDQRLLDGIIGKHVYVWDLEKELCTVVVFNSHDRTSYEITIKGQVMKNSSPRTKLPDKRKIISKLENTLFIDIATKDIVEAEIDDYKEKRRRLMDVLPTTP